MDSTLAAPRTALEWQVLAVLLVGFYTVITFVIAGELFYAISMGVFGGLGTTVVLAVLVFAWRGLVGTTAQREET